jgi:hypothetical protein
MFVRNYKIGADIEVFLQKKETGEIVSAEGHIKGTKDEPFIYDESSKYNAVSLDNVMAEFCINPAKTPAEFYFEIEKALKYINSVIPKDLETVAVPAAYLDEKYLQTENAKKFGCEPDYNAWTEVANQAPGTTGNMRTGGGHIHIGYEESDEFLNLCLVKAMDIFVGVPSILLEPENERKTLYGKAGAFRHKKYGVEYRTVSNYYLQSEELTNWIFRQTEKAIEFVNSGGTNRLDAQQKEDIVNAINYNNADLARVVIDRYNVKLVA